MFYGFKNVKFAFNCESSISSADSAPSDLCPLDQSVKEQALMYLIFFVLILFPPLPSALKTYFIKLK